MSNPYGAPQPGPYEQPGQYGAVPPPSGPPSGPPGGGFPPMPPFPPPPSGKGNKLWLIVGAAVVGVLALAGIGVLLLVLLSGGDDDEKAGGDESSSAVTETTDSTGDTPEDVVTEVLDAAKDDDCDSAKELLTGDALDDDPCSSDEFEALASGGVDFEVGSAEIDDDQATVPVEFTGPDGGESYVFELKLVDEAWLVDSWQSGPAPTDGTTSTDDPTDASTGAAPTPGGSSTASAVPNEPAAVTKAFMESVLDGDCATAIDLATAKAAKQGSACTSTDIPSGLGDSTTVTTGKATINGDKATVPATVEIFGQEQKVKASLVKEGGRWKVDDIQ